MHYKDKSYLAHKMKKDKKNMIVLFFMTSLLVKFSSSQKILQSTCKSDQYFTKQRGCIKLCSTAIFKDCNQVYTALWDPKYCALSNDGVWQSFTFACQACQSGQYIGVADGSCEQQIKLNNGGRPVDQCIWMKCSAGYECKNSKCIKVNRHKINQQKCALMICQTGTTCVNGKCIKKQAEQVCPSSSPYQQIQCSGKRPTQQQCPFLVYIMPPSPAICGITNKGERINFVRQCQACKDPSINSYFNTPCHRAPFICDKSQTCNSYYCSSKGCKNNEQCPYDWQICADNQCIDKCSFLKCASCQFGKCLYEEAYGYYCQIFRSEDCPNKQWDCIGTQCVDLCEKQQCPINHSCHHGVCYKNQ